MHNLNNKSAYTLQTYCLSINLLNYFLNQQKWLYKQMNSVAEELKRKLFSLKYAQFVLNDQNLQNLYLFQMLTTDQQQKALNILLQKKQNALCADCNAKSPCWVSLDFGVFICMNCSGAHRGLGPTVTRVRSTKLDTWNRQWLDNMKIGNTVLNEYWQNQLVGISRASKPNVNSSLKEIIKFVEEKYLKKSFVDPNQPLDPLKRWKMGQFDTSAPKQTVQPKVAKEAVRSKSIIQTSDFSVFSQILPSKVGTKPQTRKKSDNLLSFQLSEETKKHQSLLGSFAEHPSHSSTVNKYDHAQFHTISGYNASSPAKQDWVNFDNLVKKNEQTHVPHHNKPILPNNHSNHFIHSNHNPVPFQSNAGHYSMGHYGGHQNQAPQYDKAQYITMNINMNMYPKVMNINMSTPPQQQPMMNTQPSPQTTNFNTQFLGGYPSNAAKPSTITLQSNINLDTLGVSSSIPQKKSEQKSWTDDWK